MSRESSARCYQKTNKEKIQTNSLERYQNLTEEEKKTKSENMVVNDMRIFQIIKSKR